VDVRLVVPRRTDARVVDAAGRTYHDALTEAGARVHLYGPPMLHSKICVVDRTLGIVGSANLDNRSFRLNFEVTAVLQGGPAVDALAAMLEEDLRCAPERRHREADAPFLSRLGASAARLLAPQL
jgi:cardiolipin synthase A/B